jgi:hypothetical protein
VTTATSPDISVGPSWQRRCGHALGGRLVGPHSGRKEEVGRLVGCRPTQGEKAFLFNFAPIFYLIQI